MAKYHHLFTCFHTIGSHHMKETASDISIFKKIYRCGLKRGIDICIATVAIVLLAPILLVVAVAILSLDGRPIIFVQMRVGRGGRIFSIYKFRTMTSKKNTGIDKTQFDPGKNSRITKVGKLLRSTKLDELPQLFNVIKGDMALVGPRPEVSYWVEQFSERWAVIHTVRPGISDRASIVYRDEEDLLSKVDNPNKLYKETILPRKLSLYEEYVDSHGIKTDLKIILDTLKTVLRRQA